MRTSRKRSPQEGLFPADELPVPSLPGADELDGALKLPSSDAVEVRDRALRSLADGELKRIKHPVELATITPLIGKLSFLGRKVWEFLVSYTLSDLADVRTTSDGIVWRVSTSVLKRDASYDSNNTRYLKGAVTELQRTLVAWSSSARDKNGEVREWSQTQLLGSVEFVIDVNGRPCIEWSFTPVLLKQLREHRHYFTSELSLIAQMRRHSTLALYKLVCRYATMPGGMTPRAPWRSYVPVLTGQPDPSLEGIVVKKQPSEDVPPPHSDYRYFNRDVISKAVAELNSLQADFWVVPVTSKKVGARSVEDLAFKITLRDGYRKPAPAVSLAVDMKAVAALEEQGVSQRIAQDLCAQYGSEAVLEAVAQAQRVVESAGHNPIKNVAGFIVSELKKKRAQKPPPMPPQAQSPLAGDVAAARDELTQDIRTFLITKVKSEWEVWPERTRRDHLDRFEATELPTTPQAVRRLWNPLLPLKNPLISARFFMWLASTRESAWNPSDATLLVFKNSSSETPSNQDATKISPGPSSH